MEITIFDKTVRPEYPRPQFVREEWLSLNGEWDFKLDGEDWQKILVPFAYQCPASGVKFDTEKEHVSYKRNLTIPADWIGKNIILHFGAVDYEAKVYVNKNFAGSHKGGNIGFSLDITSFLNFENSQEELVVEVFDPIKDESIPRGKQAVKESSHGIWYTRTTGIWQTVWLEPVENVSITYLKFTPDIDKGTVRIDYELKNTIDNLILAFEISLKGEKTAGYQISVLENRGFVDIDVFSNHIFKSAFHGDGGLCWSPSSPTLFDLKARLISDNRVYDEVSSYFGMRKVSVENGRVWLNNRPFYQKLILDQGYWIDTLMTAPSDEALKDDIIRSKEMGFNGCRKHQKAEDPRFLYWADTLGYLVWSEIGACMQFSQDTVSNLMEEWREAIIRDYNHPSILAWVPVNESWGVPDIARDKSQQALALALYYQAKALDPTRFVVSNDGWEITVSDICAFHHYDHGSPDDEDSHKRFSKSISTIEDIINYMPCDRKIYADGYHYSGEPVLLTEFGGISANLDLEQKKTNEGADWGYTNAKDEKELELEYDRLICAISESSCICGFCYTQLTDVEQEKNGLLTADRHYKVNPESIAKSNARIK